MADRKGMKRVFGYLGSFGSAGDVHFSSEMPTFASFGEILKSAASPTGKDMPKRCGKISEILRACWVDSELSDNIPDIPKIDLAAVAPTNQTNGIWKATGAFDGFRFTLEKISPRF